MDNLMRKSLNPEDPANQSFQKYKLGNGPDGTVPRDFMIKTAYVRKRRPTNPQANH
jgi:hypothetical protein